MRLFAQAFFLYLASVLFLRWVIYKPIHNLAESLKQARLGAQSKSCFSQHVVCGEQRGLHFFFISEILKIMLNYSQLILGFKKKVQLQYAFNDSAHKKLIIILFSLLILVIVTGLLFVYQPFSEKLPSLNPKPTAAVLTPTPKTPKTNPFETKTNPFKDIKTNPFR